MCGRIPAVCGRIPAECGHIPVEYGRIPAECGRIPAECGRILAECGRNPVCLVKNGSKKTTVTTTKCKRLYLGLSSHVKF